MGARRRRAAWLRAFVCAVVFAGLFATSSVKAAPARGLYVTDGAAAATDAARREDLLNLVTADSFTTVVLYGLAPVLEGEQGAQQLAALFTALRARGVTSIGAPIADSKRLQAVLNFEQRSGVQFDLLVTEFEYWNHCAGRRERQEIREECFSPMQALVRAMQHASPKAPRRIGAYLGRANRAELGWLAKNLDFVFLDFPVRSPDDLFERKTDHTEALLDRMRWAAERKLEFWPILYARGEAPMRAWLGEHGLSATEEEFLQRLRRDERRASATSRLAGFIYFTDDAVRGLRP